MAPEAQFWIGTSQLRMFVLNPGLTGKFTGMYRKVSWDMAFSSLDSLGNLGKCQWAYRESLRFTGISRWAPQYFTGVWPVNFQFPGKSLYLFLLGTSHIIFHPGVKTRDIATLLKGWTSGTTTERAERAGTTTEQTEQPQNGPEQTKLPGWCWGNFIV